jgi:hypothetical protein
MTSFDFIGKMMTFHHNVEFIVKYRFIRVLCYFLYPQKKHILRTKKTWVVTHD